MRVAEVAGNQTGPPVQAPNTRPARLTTKTPAITSTLSIATTHTQARYVLPEKVAALRSAYPKVNISLHQGSPDQVARMLIDEVAEIGIATESLADYSETLCTSS